MIQPDPGIDMDLIQRARCGHRESGDTLAHWAQARVYPYVYRMTLDHHLAQDLCQDALMEMTRSLSRLTLNQPGDLRAWLYKTALSKVRRHYRRRPIRSLSTLASSDRDDLEVRTARPDPGPAIIERQDSARIIWQAMEQLKPKYRHVLALRCFDELSFAEIAAIQGGTELQARLLFFRAKAHLRGQLARRGQRRGQWLGALGLFGAVTSWPKGPAASAAVAEATLKVGPAAAALGALTSVTGLLVAAIAACLAMAAPSMVAGLAGPSLPRIDPAAALVSQEVNDVDQVVARVLPQMDYVTVALIRDGRLAFARSYGKDADVLRPIPYASISKSVTATLIMQLVEQGRIRSLDEPFWNYCPQYQGCMPEAYRDSPVTLRHLLCHSSGLPNKLDDPWRQEGKLALLFRPGTSAAYSSAGYYVLGQVLEHVTGRAYEDLVHDRIARPLGLRSMTVWPGFWASCGGVQSNIEDFARLAIAIMDGSLLKPESLELMWRRHSDLWGGDGLGWFVQNEGTDDVAVRHGGRTGLTNSKILLRPRHRNGVVLCASGRLDNPYADADRLDQDTMKLAQDLLALLK
jgi:RNA polymerase sigma factor (sigma-70 family)